MATLAERIIREAKAGKDKMDKGNEAKRTLGLASLKSSKSDLAMKREWREICPRSLERLRNT